VVVQRFNVMEKLDKTSPDFAVMFVLKHLFINNHLSKNVMNNIGLNYGLKKAIQ
jgi:hypothetical protein